MMAGRMKSRGHEGEGDKAVTTTENSLHADKVASCAWKDSRLLGQDDRIVWGCKRGWRVEVMEGFIESRMTRLGAFELRHRVTIEARREWSGVRAPLSLPSIRGHALGIL